MRIEIEIAFSFKRMLDPGYRSLELPGTSATVLDALQALVRRYPSIQGRLLDEDGRVLKHINALVNGENVQYRRGFETCLEDNDRLSILPPVGGG